jgi:hypothetical protein
VAERAEGDKSRVLQSGTVAGYRESMAHRRIPKNQAEPPNRESLESFKAFLGPIAGQYTDAQLVQLRSDMHAAARLLLDLYLLKKQRQN